MMSYLKPVLIGLATVAAYNLIKRYLAFLP